MFKSWVASPSEDQFMDCINGLGGRGGLSSMIICCKGDKDSCSEAMLGVACHCIVDNSRILCLRESFLPCKVSCSFFRETSLDILALCLSDKSEYFIWSSNNSSMVSSHSVESQEHLASSRWPMHCQTNSVIESSWSCVTGVVSPMTGIWPVWVCGSSLLEAFIV